MATRRDVYLGIDLGTTNSAAALFDGERVDLIRTAQGTTTTPSVVRIDARGNIVVGSRARRMAEEDPENVRAEFKRLMGSPHGLRFPASGLQKRPEDLSAEVLRAIREDVRAQFGFLPARAAIGVPALFELPQTAATSEAARLSGFERVELIQEPVASAIAAGWKADDDAGAWLVYDLGGGTFDVSLLETREGFLRVIGHDGDNFLGGRDFDAAVVDWLIERIAAEHGAVVVRANPAHAVALQRLRAAAEDARIELTRSTAAEVNATLELGGPPLHVSLALDRGTLERLVEPLVMRTIAVSGRLLAAHGIAPKEGALSRVVLVGGLTAMPMLRVRVGETLAAPFGDGLDPMTLVAQGAALYAASAALDARPTERAASVTNAARLWLQYPAMSSDTNPYVVGRLVDLADTARVAVVIVRRSDEGWASEPEPIAADGTFAVMTSLSPRHPNTLLIEGYGRDGVTPVTMAPATFTIVHGMSVGDPPLSRSVGVALASDRVRVFFERGSPLPMRRTFGLRTVEALSPGDPKGSLRVPIVQGEFPLAHLCRLVGTLDVHASALKALVPAGSLIEVTIDLDRGGRLSASARVGQTSQVFDQVAHLVSAAVPLEEIGARLGEVARRLQTLRAKAFAHGVRDVLKKTSDAETALSQAARDAEAAQGGDLDAQEKVRRLLIDIDGLIGDAESELSWPELDASIRDRIGVATGWVAQLGTPEERKVLAAAVFAAEKARAVKNAQDVDRQVAVIAQLGLAAYFRNPGAWESALDSCAARTAVATDPRAAVRLVEEGRAAARRGDTPAVERAVRGLWHLSRDDAQDRALGHQSGVR